MSFLDRVKRAYRAFRHPADPQAAARHEPPRPFQTYEERMRRWESASTNRLNSGHWASVAGTPINADLSSRLDTLRARSEYEVANNPLVEGMISTYTLSILGSDGPTLRIVSEDHEYNRKREQVWKNWSRHAGANQQLALVDILRLWVRALWQSGEFLTQLVTVPDAEGPVKMRLLPIHPHRLLTPPSFLGDPEVAMGVRRDLKNRRPVCYYISEPYILGAFEVYTGEFLEIPYRDLLHGFVMIEEDQVRGVPWLAPCLDSVAELRDYKASTLDAARAAADWGVYLWTAHPDSPYISANESMEFERRQVRHLPPGWQPTQVQAQQPPANWETFYHALVREIGRPNNMPLMMVLLDSSQHNYSSARFDGQLFWRGAAYSQGFLGRNLDRLESDVADEARLAGELPPPPASLTRQWIWPRQPHVDQQKEAMADRIEMENGSKTLADVCAEDNRTLEDVIAERQRINKQLEDAGLPPIPGIPDGPAAPIAPPGQDGWSDAGGEADGKNGNRKGPGGRLNGNGKPNGRLPV